ncbi:MAG TPA: universal stress protein [Gemmatimonadaceae bacterium]|jgi:nucleotide-binding universal stress UspA family protein
MYKNIMVPTDGSGFDREAILLALRVAERCEAKLRLVRVISTGAFFGVAGTPEVAVPLDAVGAQQDAALSELYALAAECRSLSSADITVDLEQGPVAEVLEGYAKRNEIDLIVISSHGRRGIARLSLGSVTDSLIRETTIPVLVVKPKASYLNPEASKEFRHVVVPLDGSTLAEQILTRIVPLAKLEDAEITLLHVLTPEKDDYRSEEDAKLPWWEKRVTGAQTYLSRRAGEIRRQGVAATFDVVLGEKVSDAITDYARREGADLIAIATHGRGGLARVIRGSVADAVTKSAMSSILVFHPDKALERKAPRRPVEKVGQEELAGV